MLASTIRDLSYKPHVWQPFWGIWKYATNLAIQCQVQGEDRKEFSFKLLLYLYAGGQIHFSCCGYGLPWHGFLVPFHKQLVGDHSHPEIDLPKSIDRSYNAPNLLQMIPFYLKLLPFSDPHHLLPQTHSVISLMSTELTPTYLAVTLFNIMWVLTHYFVFLRKRMIVFMTQIWSWSYNKIHIGALCPSDIQSNGKYTRGLVCGQKC